ncbi:2-dehydropantoate 2-reductase [Cohnella pontilimi]|uniref:2-dehydropantoate 2-reductase n=1 Tax=Cohnella pontilimi TaxID=2564100 RepID=A0A4U0FEW1_9BACL|nr:2-dehydropantoate 2-reductase [Cohnella pontilimi]TJY43387.1 2-dehydropantoate 2-reductase [Cohnella pontilimi]
MTEIAVMGGGALGMLLAGKLGAAGCDVVLWTRSEDQAGTINREGITVESAASELKHVVPVRAIPLREVKPGYRGNVLLTVKQTAVGPALLEFLAKTLAEDGAVTLFQNGVGHVEPAAAALPGRRLLAAVTTEGALRTGTASVRHTGSGQTWIGSPSGAAGEAAGSAEHDETLIQMMEQAGFSVFMSNNIRERMLRKLLINAVINPLTAIWRVTNGELTATSGRQAVMEALFRETAHILQRTGLSGTDSSELWNSVLAVCSATSANRSSMLQDVLNGRETEIDALNGAVCRLAESAKIEAPLNAALTVLVKGIRSPEERKV